LTPYKYITYLDKKGKPQAVVDYIIRESLKLGTQNHYLDGTPLLFEASQLLNSPTFVDERDQKRSERVAIGLHFEY
jgi:tRNA nucleotidyltransferase (CCA-adding enzyme)